MTPDLLRAWARSRWSRDDRAGASLELVLLAPVLLGLMTLMYALGVYAHTEQLVYQASRDAARVATQARSAEEADTKVQATVEDVLAGTVAPCRNGDIASWESSTGGFDVAPLLSGEPTTMLSVSVTCDVDLGDVVFIPFPDVDPLTSTFVSPLDALRGVY